MEHADVLSMGTPDSIGAAFGAHSRAPSLVLARFPVSYAPSLPLLHDWRMTFRGSPVSADRLAAACHLRTNATRHAEDDLIPFLDIWQRSCAAVHAMNNALAVVLAWTVIEAMIDRFWQRYLDVDRSRTVEGAEWSSDTPGRRASGRATRVPSIARKRAVRAIVRLLSRMSVARNAMRPPRSRHI